MASLYNSYGRAPTFQGDNGNVRLPQAYAKWSDIPQLNGATLWAGRRYYKRHDVHIADFYFWNPSGTGFGLEDYRLGGDLKLSYAFSRNDNWGRRTRPISTICNWVASPSIPAAN